MNRRRMASSASRMVGFVRGIEIFRGWEVKQSLILTDGGAEGSRTPDLLIANKTLYQLSYDPKPFSVNALRRFLRKQISLVSPICVPQDLAWVPRATHKL